MRHRRRLTRIKFLVDARRVAQIASLSRGKRKKKRRGRNEKARGKKTVRFQNKCVTVGKAELDTVTNLLRKVSAKGWE